MSSRPLKTLYATCARTFHRSVFLNPWEFVEPKLPQHFIKLTIQILQRLNLGAKTQFTTCLKHSISNANITL